MSEEIKVCVVGERSASREAVAETLSAAVTTVTSAASLGEDRPDCVVGVPAARPEALAADLGALAAPTVMYVPTDVDASGLYEAGVTRIVRSDGTGSDRALRRAVRQCAAQQQTVAADGGQQTDSVVSEFPLKRLHEIATDRELSRMAKIDALLTAGADQLGTSSAFLSRIDGETQEIVTSVGDHPELTPGGRTPLSETYCQYTISESEPLTVTDAARDETIPDERYEQWDLQCYLGATITVNGEQFGTVCFVDSEPRKSPFDEQDRHFAEVLTDWIGYLLEQRAYERELDEQRAFTESLMNSLPDPLFATDDLGQLIRWNDRFEELVSEADIEGKEPAQFVVNEDRDRLTEAIGTALGGEASAVEATVQVDGDREHPYEFSNAPLRDETGSISGVATVGRDVTERQATQEQLAGILDTTRSLMQARDRDHVAEIAVNAAKDLLGFDLSVFRLYDSDAGTLVPAAMTDETTELLGERPIYDVGEGYPGEVFASGEPQIINDLDEADALGPTRSVMYYPVGVHGTISVSATEADAFDERDQQMLALLATSAAAACMRAKREQDVREAQAHTERVLDRVNGLVQNTVEVLVQAQTREELEAGVVEELAHAEPYSFAWIGQPDVASETLSPSEWAGDASLPIQGRSFPLAATDEPVSRAYRDEQPQILTNLSDASSGPWASIVGDSGVNSLLAIPLVYKDANYGVLTVLAEDEDALDERERIVLESLGRVIANAINAIERGRILDATEIIELEFSISDQELLFSRLSAATDCVLESAGTDYSPDGSIRLYLTARGVDADELVSIAEDDVAVQTVTCIVDNEEECLLELTVEDSLLATLTEYGAAPREVTAEHGTARFIVELPYEAEARDLFELVEDQYPSTELLGYHERERPVETRQEFRASLSERFTDRQETALRTAYLGGFFDWPREVDGNELAEAMDISRPTYHQHLRSAQKKVFEELFD
ncbi:GAF domain-containing protein [Halovenus sp. WSH3]|uniref:GAF domain-containing protein n=1 Tax=Halovenus carboxidivorans TaxID=2692199 RepID=A0A6B0T2G7_9EURY|nr:bacterio-opsin activator domain-containing protein [Halovenus carboxidivorans]MXR52165.1 GAF domain-containing protein [Halovenus carboxidivorans]